MPQCYGFLQYPGLVLVHLDQSPLLSADGLQDAVIGSDSLKPETRHHGSLTDAQQLVA